MSAPLVLLHGFAGGPESWDSLRGSLRPASILAPRLFGHGADGATEPTRSFDSEIDRLALALAAHAAGMPVHLVGYSLGARFALGLIVRHPRLVSRATLVGVNPGLSQFDRPARQAHDAEWIHLLEASQPPGAQPMHVFADRWLAQDLFRSQQALPDEVRARRRALLLSNTAPGLARSLRHHGLSQMPDWRPQLHAVRIPVTLVAGVLDPKFTALAREAARDLVHAHVRIIDGAGHDVVLERPRALAEVINQETP